MMATKPKSGHAYTVAGVKTFARQYGLTISPKPGDSPLIGRGEWYKLFDTWEDAAAYFVKERNKHIDDGTPYPWADRNYPGPVDGEPFGPRMKNPTAKKPTPAQLAARKAFAAAAKAGTLKKGATIKRNPSKKTAKKRAFPINSTGYGIITPKTLKYRVQANGPAGFGTVADFAKLADAEQYGRAYADMSGVQVRIVTGK